MALLYRADLSPSKLELLAAWLPKQSWYRGPAAPEPERVTAFRFDDPDGEVGIETIVVRVGDGPLLQTPLTYRAAPLPGAEAWLLGTTEHSVLGTRWVYDACGDPVYAAALTAAVLTGGGQAEEMIDMGDGRLERREPHAVAKGSGTAASLPATKMKILSVDGGDPAVIVTDAVELTALRTLGGTAPGDLTLTATWKDQPDPVLLATARTR
ncbi:hypothetical protein [Dactylosporangium sp. NPDC048998]|uniref:CG0192-related protein n=1 Tax=Dactylosporangium sp. NPDC048998 TaxID=3363976 RepID=UPI003711AA24